MNNNIEIFKNESFGEIRVTGTSEEPLFCLSDVCKALDLRNASQVKTRLNLKGVQMIDLQALCKNEGVIINELGNTKATFINEGNLYRCVFQSRKPDADVFQDWICDEVIPSIRKTGLYATDVTIEKMLANPDFAIQALLNLKKERQKRIEAEQKVVESAPAVAFTNAVQSANSSCLIGELAKLIAQNGYPIGEKRLFAWMRENGYLGKHGERYNVPNQQYIEQGLFEIKKGVRSGNGGVLHTTITSKITGKGQVYFVNKFLANIPTTSNNKTF